MFGPGSELTGVGASFQPGTAQSQDQYGRGPYSAGSGVQEAIKILSLRLPRVVGAQAMAPSLLLNSPGGGGNPMIDQVLERAWRKIMGGGPNSSNVPAVPVLPSGGDGGGGYAGSGSGPNFSGTSAPQQPYPIRPQARREPMSIDYAPVPRFTPGREPAPPQHDPILDETPLPPAPDWPGADPLPSDAMRADLRARGFPV